MGEFGVQGVEMDRFSRGGSVEGQAAGRLVDVHAYLMVGSGGGAGGDELPLVIVADGITAVVGAAQTPGHVVESELAVVAVSFASDSSVAHRDLHLPAPYDLPVAAVRKAFIAQNLGPPVEPVRVIRIGADLVHTRDLPVVIGQSQFSIHRVWVDGDPTGIWWRKTIQLQLLIN